MRLQTLVVIWILGVFTSLAQKVKMLSLADSLDEQAALCSRQNDNEQAVRLATEAVHLRAQQPNNPSLAYALSVNRLSKYLSYTGRLSDAINWGKQALGIIESINGRGDKTYAQALSDQAGYYSRAGDYNEALRLGTEAMHIRDSVLGTDHPDYAQSLNNVARYHSYLGNYMEAVRMGRKAMELKEKLYGKEHPDYAQSVSNLAGYLSRMGNYDEAIRLGQLALEIREKTLGKEHPDYAQSLNNLAKYHYFTGEYDLSIQLERQALSIREKIDGKMHPAYATALSNLADFYDKTGKMAEAMRYGTEAMEIRKTVLGDQHPDYAESLANLADYHSAMGHSAEAVELEEKVLSLQEQVLGPDHPAYVQSLCKMAAYYADNSQLEESERYSCLATEQYTKVILNTFADLTSNERDLYWMKVKPWFTKTILQLMEKNPTHKMVSSAYNGTLLAKGLLLKSEQEMVNLLMESGDTAAVGDYRKLQADRILLLRVSETPKKLRTHNLDSLQRLITKQERRLVKRSKTYGNYTKPLRVEWQNIVDQLRNDDIAVEFIYYKNVQGRGRYAALVVTKHSAHPELIFLMDDEQLQAIAAKDIYSSNQLSAMLWQPLRRYLEKAQRVFFAPAGELYNIAVESLPYWEGTEPDEVMSDRWNLYRLSSTREIVLADRKGRRQGLAASVFGGMNYDTKTIAADGKEEYEHHDTKKGAAKYLPATKKEAEEIGHNFTDHDIPLTLHVGDHASERIFKSLSGHSTSIVHVATHGFYWTDSEVRDDNMDKRLQFLSMYGNMDDADKALTRSGLLFTGANHALRGDLRQKRGDDGVLTAKEISLLDLHGVDLLVLSACQTGLGRITGDGVFGLQRGFKKAGAHTLLMSLWKVDDVATRLLMSKFYDYLMQGYTKHEALRCAQQDLRYMEVDTKKKGRRAFSARTRRAQKNTVKKPYSDPYYWAAFILLDAID